MNPVRWGPTQGSYSSGAISRPTGTPTNLHDLPVGTEYMLSPQHFCTCVYRILEKTTDLAEDPVTRIMVTKVCPGHDSMGRTIGHEFFYSGNVAVTVPFSRIIENRVEPSED